MALAILRVLFTGGKARQHIMDFMDKSRNSGLSLDSSICLYLQI